MFGEPWSRSYGLYNFNGFFDYLDLVNAKTDVGHDGFSEQVTAVKAAT